MAGADEMDRGKSPQQLAMEAEEMAAEESDFARYTRLWNSQRGSDGCDSFPDMTTVSSMHFTHLMPGGGYPSNHPSRVAPTLQIFSVKISEIKGGLQWPLPVYGVVPARDAVDHNRNLLFARHRSACQILTEDDPFLRLVGPSRAIVFEDPVDFEIQLRVRGGTVSGEDRALITGARRYSAGGGTIGFSNCFCTTELRLDVIERTVQATVLGVRLKQGCAWPSQHGGRVVCLAPSRSREVIDGQVTHVTDPRPAEVVLLDSRLRRPMPTTGLLHCGCLRFSRQVVSVEIQGSLEVVLQAYSSPSGGVAAQGRLCFAAQQCGTSHGTCSLGGAELEVTVAWSRLVSEKQHIALQGWVLEE